MPIKEQHLGLQGQLSKEHQLIYYKTRSVTYEQSEILRPFLFMHVSM